MIASDRFWDEAGVRSAPPSSVRKNHIARASVAVEGRFALKPSTAPA